MYRSKAFFQKCGKLHFNSKNLQKSWNVKVLKKKKTRGILIRHVFHSCNKWKSLWGFLASSSHSFCLWDLFLISDLFSVICVCWVPLISWILLLKRLTGVLKLARNLQFEIGYGFFFKGYLIPSPWGSLSGKLINLDWYWKGHTPSP